MKGVRSLTRGLKGLGRSAGATLVVGNLSASAMGILAGVLTARWLGPEGRGRLETTVYWAQLLAAVADVGISEALTLRIAAHPSRSKQHLTAALSFALPIGAICWTIGYFGLPYVLHGDQLELLPQTRLFLILVPVMLLSFLTNGALMGLQLFHRAAAFRAGTAFFLLLTIASAASLHELTPTTVAWLRVLAIAASVALFAPSVIRTLQGSLRCASDGLDQLYTGLRIQPARVADLLPRLSQRGLANLILPATSLGIFQIPISLAFLIPFVSRALGQLIFARHGRLDAAGRARATYVTYVRTFLVTVPATALVAIALPLLVPLAYGVAYVDATQPAIIILLAAIFHSQSIVLQASSRAHLNIGPILLAELLALLAFAVCAVLLVPRLGLSGMALGYLAGRITSYAMMVLAAPRHIGLPISDLSPLSQRFRQQAMLEARAAFRLFRSPPAA